MVQPVSSSSFSPIAIGVCENPSLFEKVIGILPFAPGGLGATIAAKPLSSRQIYHHTQKWTGRLLDILEEELGGEETLALIKKSVEKKPLPNGYTLDNMSKHMRLHALIQSLKGDDKGVIRLNLSKSDFEHIEREVLKLSARIEAELAKGLLCYNESETKKIEITHKGIHISRIPVAAIAFTLEMMQKHKAARVIFQFNNCFIVKVPREISLLGEHLVELHLSSNRLTAVPQLALEKLERLQLGGNTFARLEERVFAQLPQLKQLELHHCKIREIAAGAFEGLGNLVSLSLWHNETSCLPEGVFSPLKNLKALDLHLMGLTQLLPNVFGELSNLRSLDLKCNNVTLPREIFTNLTELFILDLEEMGLTTLPDLKNNKKLQHFYYSYNPDLIVELPIEN